MKSACVRRSKSRWDAKDTFFPYHQSLETGRAQKRERHSFLSAEFVHEGLSERLLQWVKKMGSSRKNDFAFCRGMTDVGVREARKGVSAFRSKHPQTHRMDQSLEHSKP